MSRTRLSLLFMSIFNLLHIHSYAPPRVLWEGREGGGLTGDSVLALPVNAHPPPRRYGLPFHTTALAIRSLSISIATAIITIIYDLEELNE